MESSDQKPVFVLVLRYLRYPSLKLAVARSESRELLNQMMQDCARKWPVVMPVPEGDPKIEEANPQIASSIADDAVVLSYFAENSALFLFEAPRPNEPCIFNFGTLDSTLKQKLAESAAAVEAAVRKDWAEMEANTVLIEPRQYQTSGYLAAGPIDHGAPVVRTEDGKVRQHPATLTGTAETGPGFLMNEVIAPDGRINEFDTQSAVRSAAETQETGAPVPGEGRQDVP